MMQEKPKRKSKNSISRRRFLQVGLATITSVATGFTTRWLNPRKTPTALVANCALSWAAPNMTRINPTSSELLQSALQADGMNPTLVEVYDRAMEYQTCYDAEGNVLSRDLLYRDNERALVIFTADAFSMNKDTHSTAIENVLEILNNIDAFRLQTIEVQLTDGNDNTLVWQAPFYASQLADSDDLYGLGFNLQL